MSDPARLGKPRAVALEAVAVADPVLDASSPLFVVSPHLDDAVFGCAALLATRPGARVCTVFAGTPAVPQCRPWDAAAGFDSARDAMAERLHEDARALACCGACGLYLDFLDDQYGVATDLPALAAALARQLSLYRGAVPLLPLGLRHPDHRRVADAWLGLLQAGQIGDCLVYEEALHRSATGETERRLDALDQAGLRITPLDDTWCAARVAPPARDLKRQAVAAYASQLRAFGAAALDDLARPERYWHVTRGA